MMKLKNIQKLGLKVCIKGNKKFFLCNFILTYVFESKIKFKLNIYNNNDKGTST